MRKIFNFWKNNFNFQAGILITLTIILYGALINNLNLWLDEIYSVLMAKDSFHDMWILLSTEDSKPPLYYLYLKFILLFFPKTYEIWGAHFASCLLLIVAQFFAATSVRKDFGNSTALWLIFILMVMPISLWLAFEVRSYMLSNLLLLMALVYGMRLLNKPSCVDFIKFGMVSLLALYSHYYCAIWLFFLYAILLFSMIKNKLNVQYFILTALVVGVCFAPWLYIPLSTGDQISKNWYLHAGYIKFSWQFFTNPLNPEIFQSVYFIATTFASAVFSFMLIFGICNKFSNKRSSHLFNIGFFSFILTYALLIALSYLFRPIISARYLKIFSLVLYLLVAIVMAHFPKLKIPFFIASIIGFIFTYADIYTISFDKGYQIAVKNIREYIPRNSTLLTFDNSNLFCEYYLPEYKCLLATDGNGEILRKPKILSNISGYYHEPDLVTFSISILYNPENTDNCRLYVSNYRYGQSIHLCRHNFEETKKFYSDSLKALRP